MFSFAAVGDDNEWGVTRNPAAGISRFHEEKRERWLSEEEFERLVVAMQEYPDRSAAEADVSEKQREFLRKEARRAMNAIRLTVVTGCRKGEALTAKWTDFDFARGVWTKPSHHTKQKRVEHVPLNKQALALLESLPRNGEYLFPGRREGAHLTDLKGPWAKVSEVAKLFGVRIHDLRHSFASHLVSSGASLPIVGKLLGHTQPQTTARYAHLADNPLREASNRIVSFTLPKICCTLPSACRATPRASVFIFPVAFPSLRSARPTTSFILPFGSSLFIRTLLVGTTSAAQN
jgi:integrase